MTQQEADRLVEILTVLSGQRRVRGKGLYLARSIALTELKGLVLKYGASNVLDLAARMEFVPEMNGSIDNWTWTDCRSVQPSVTRNRQQTASGPSAPTEDQIYRIHQAKLDVARGQTCNCDVCTKFKDREETKVETSGSDRPSRWKLLEID